MRVYNPFERASHYSTQLTMRRHSHRCKYQDEAIASWLIVRAAQWKYVRRTWEVEVNQTDGRSHDIAKCGSPWNSSSHDIVNGRSDIWN